MAKKPAAPAKKAPVRKKPAKAKDSLQLSEVRAQIDGLDRQIQDLITQRATWAQKVRAAKGELKAVIGMKGISDVEKASAEAWLKELNKPVK